MASKSAALGSLLYSTESSFGETSSSTASRVRPVEVIDTSGLTRQIQKIDIFKQYPTEMVNGVRMPYTDASFSVLLNLTGLGSSASSSPASSDLVTFLGAVFGTAAAGLSTGTTATGGTATAPTTTAASGITAGALVRFGAKNDTRADGQWTAVSTHSSNTANLLVGLPAAPSNGDVVYCSRLVYPSETAGTYETQTSFRFLIQTAQQQYLCRGCYPTSAEFMLNVGEVPKVRITFAVARPVTTTATFPTATSVQDFGAAPVAGGSLFMNTLATSTRSTHTIRSFNFSWALNNTPEMSVNGNYEDQVIVGCNRGPADGKIEMVVDSEAAGTDTFGDLWDTDENSRNYRHILYSMSVADGRALAMYFPKCVWMDAKPVQMNDNGVLRKKLSFMTATGTTTTSDLTLSPWRLAFA